MEWSAGTLARHSSSPTKSEFVCLPACLLNTPADLLKSKSRGRGLPMHCAECTVRSRQNLATSTTQGSQKVRYLRIDRSNHEHEAYIHLSYIWNAFSMRWCPRESDSYNLSLPCNYSSSMQSTTKAHHSYSHVDSSPDIPIQGFLVFPTIAFNELVPSSLPAHD